MITETPHQIRDALSVDIERIFEIQSRLISSDRVGNLVDPPDILNITAVRNMVLQNGHPYIIAETSGTVSGYAYVQHYNGTHVYSKVVESHVYVHPDFQSIGVGTALLQTLIEQCIDVGQKQMIAFIEGSTNRKAITLYRSAEFRFVGILESVLIRDDQELDCVIMQKNLLSELDN
jgi:phosphinothricin acetyltransferase